MTVQPTYPGETPSPDENLIATLQRLDDERIIQANIELADALESGGMLALPSDFSVHDLEHALRHRRRLRGKFRTSRIADFVAYARAGRDDLKPTVFVSNDSLVATAVLNIGDMESPGHADDRAHLILTPTAEWRALQEVDGTVYSQAEFLDRHADWDYAIDFVRAGKTVPTAAAVAALRDVSITRSTSRSFLELPNKRQQGSLEAVEVNALADLPDGFIFTFRPADELPVMKALCRLVLLPSEDDNPKKAFVRVRVTGLEALKAEIVREFVARLQGEFVGDATVYVGSYET